MGTYVGLDVHSKGCVFEIQNEHAEPMLVTPSAVHPSAVVISLSALVPPASPLPTPSAAWGESSGTQQTTSPPGGGVGLHGLGSHVPAPRLVPPSALHSAAVLSSHSGPSSS